MPSERPNLLFVFSDQQSSDMLGCSGNTQIITPNVDALAADGIRFTYCISSDPVCTPARAMLLSGQHPLKCGAFTNDVQMLPDNGTTFAEALHQAGYATGYVGKWHLLGGDRRRGVPAGPLRYGFVLLRPGLRGEAPARRMGAGGSDGSSPRVPGLLRCGLRTAVRAVRLLPCAARSRRRGR
jgi:arylsulfatase A-like enzyme